MKTILVILCAAFIFSSSPAFAGGWIIYHDSQYKGKVVDEETNQPIEGVAVVAIWYVQQSAWPAGPIAKFLNAKETITDKNGEFVIPSMFGFNLWPGFLDEPEVVIFKPGYSSYKEYNYKIREGNLIKLAKARTKEERIKATIDAGLCITTDRFSYDCIPINKIPNFINMMKKEDKELGLSK